MPDLFAFRPESISQILGEPVIDIFICAAFRTIKTRLASSGLIAMMRPERNV